MERSVEISYILFFMMEKPKIYYSGQGEPSGTLLVHWIY